MKEELLQRPESPQRFSGDSLNVYAQIVGINKRKFPSVEEFPSELILPLGVIGSLPDAIAATLSDERERKQSVFWDERNQTFREGTIIKGTSRSVGHREYMKDIFFGRKALLTYHTHRPNPQNSEYPLRLSPGDVAIARALPRSGYIQGVGSKDGGTFIFQTERAARLPLSAYAIALREDPGHIIIGTLEVLRRLREDPELDFREIARELDMKSFDKAEHTIDRAGFVKYTWKRDEQGNFSKGLYLTRAR